MGHTQLKKIHGLYQPTKTTFVVFCLLGIVVLVSLFIHIRLREYAFDDAYIHFRIVNNFIETGKPYFNVGESVKTSTSTGWIITLFFLAKLLIFFRLNADVTLLASVLNSFLFVINAYIYTLLTKKIINRRISNFIASIIFMMYLSISFYACIGLMETILALFFVGIALLLYIKQNKYSILIVSISVFFRPELVIVYILIIGHAIITKRFSLLNILIFSSIGIIPFFVFDMHFFGTIISTSIRAKSIIYSQTIGEALGTMINRFRDVYSFLPYFYKYPFIYLVYPIFIILFFTSLFLLRISKEWKITLHDFTTQIAVVIVLWGLITIGLYLYGRVKVFPWYDPIYIFPLSIIVVKTILDEQSKSTYLTSVILAIPILLFQLISLGVLLFSTLTNPAYYVGFSEGARVKQYIQVGRELYQQDPNAILMTSEIGGLGYGFPGYILDASGLASPDALNFYPQSWADRRKARGGIIPVSYVEAMHPDIIVSYDIFVQSLLKSDTLKEYTVTALPLFLEDDRNESRIYLPGSGNIIRVLWGIQNLYILERKK